MTHVHVNGGAVARAPGPGRLDEGIRWENRMAEPHLRHRPAGSDNANAGEAGFGRRPRGNAKNRRLFAIRHGRSATLPQLDIQNANFQQQSSWLTATRTR